MKIDGVFAGGGVKGYAFIGALEAVENKGYVFERAAGTSAGSLMAALIKAGYTSEELKKILMTLQAADVLEKTWTKERVPWLAWVSVYWRLGLYKGDKLEKWIRELLAKKNIHSFQDLPAGSLKIVASDITSGRIVVLPDDLPRYGYKPEEFPVSLAVRMSCALPYVFQPVRLKSTAKKNIVVDGGILSNFPMWLFVEEKSGKQKRPVLGFQLSPALQDLPSNHITNAIDMYQSLFDTMRKAHDLRYISKYAAKNVVFLPVEKIKSTQFDLEPHQKQQLIDIGKKETDSFFKKWH